MATKRFRRAALVTATAMMAVLGAPGTSLAASGPACGNPSTEQTNPAHCYVMALQGAPNGNPSFTSMGATFTAPSQLAVKAPAYSIAQIALSFGPSDIELGWIVAPSIYHNQNPHLFVFFRSSGGACEEGIPHQTTPYCPLNDSTGYVNLNSKYFPGMRIGGTPAFFAVGYYAADDFWYIQYHDQYFGKMSAKWWSGGNPLFEFRGGDTAEWFGEVYTPNNSATYRCTPMGNGNYGSGKNSASVTGMFYGTGGPLVTADPQLYDVTTPKYYDSNRAVNKTFTSSFSFGGPYNGPSGCKRPK